MEPDKHFINGEWVSGTDTFDSFDPSTGEVNAALFQATENEVDAAVQAGKHALHSWRNTSVDERAAILKKASELLVEEYGNEGEETQLKELIREDMGKRLQEADIEVIESSDVLSFYADRCPPLIENKKKELNKELWPSKESYIIFEPKGVVGIIKPWNYPLEIPLWSIAPALLAGNTVVFKPSEHASRVGSYITAIFEKAGIPAGVFNMITGDGEVGEMLAKHNDISMVSFTGSLASGQKMSDLCGKQMKECNLELGGNDPALVDADADSELAANGLVWGAFSNAGQVCVGTKRAYIHKDIYEKVLEKTGELVLGRDIGPIISEQHLKNIEEQVADTTDKGATLLSGTGKREETAGYYLAPIILENMDETMELMQHECFGPVLPLVSVEDMDEAIKLANTSQYGLGASVWTADNENGKQISEQLDVGMVWVNDVNVAFPESPWGGVKQSGIGFDLSEYSIYEYVNLKHVNYETSANTARDWWFPYT